MAPDVASCVSVLLWTGNCLKPVVKIAGDQCEKISSKKNYQGVKKL